MTYDTTPQWNNSEHRRLSRPRLLTLLDNLDEVDNRHPADSQIRSTFYYQPRPQITDFGLSNIDGLSSLVAKLKSSETGLVIFSSRAATYLIVPPFPVAKQQEYPGWNTTPLRELLTKERTVGLVLLRLGSYSVAVFKNMSLVSSKTGSRYVKGRHKAGGSSQARFARIRANQALRLYSNACEVVSRLFSPYEASLDCIFLGGHRITLKSFQSQCPYLIRIAPLMMNRILDVPEPRHRHLTKALAQVYTSNIYAISSDSTILFTEESKISPEMDQ